MRRELRRLGKMQAELLESMKGGRPTRPTEPAPPPDDQAADIRRDLAFRDALDDYIEAQHLSLKGSDKKRLRRLHAADKPEDTQAWLAREFAEMGGKPAPSQQRSTVVTPPAGRIDHPATTDNYWNADREVVRAMSPEERKEWFQRSTGQGSNASSVLQRHAQRKK
jgi:hypothetical protein